MDLLDDEMCMPVPANYVSLAQLKERWLKQQEETRRGERAESDGGLVVGEGESLEKGKEVVNGGSEDLGEGSKPRKKKVGKGNWIVKNGNGDGKGKGEKMESEREVEEGSWFVKKGSENGEERIKKRRDYRRKRHRRKRNKAADEKMGNEIGVAAKSLEEGIEDSAAKGDGIEIEAGVSEGLNENGGISIGVKGIEEDSRVSATEISPKSVTKGEKSNGKRAMQDGSKRDDDVRGLNGRYRYRIKKENQASGHEARDGKDNVKKANKPVDGMNANKSEVLDLKGKVEELKLEDGIAKVRRRTDDDGEGLRREGYVAKSSVAEEYKSEQELSDGNAMAKSKEKAAVGIAEKSGENGGRRGKGNGKRNDYVRAEENGERRGRRNGSKGYGRYNEFQGVKTSGNGLVWVKKGEKFAANASKVEPSGVEVEGSMFYP